jgi:hypothetical protein
LPFFDVRANFENTCPETIVTTIHISPALVRCTLTNSAKS